MPHTGAGAGAEVAGAGAGAEPGAGAGSWCKPSGKQVFGVGYLGVGQA